MDRTSAITPPKLFTELCPFDWTIGGANYAARFLWTAYANDSQQVITVSSHFNFVLIVVVPVGFVSTDFCAKAAFFLLNSRGGVRMKCIQPFTIEYAFVIMQLLTAVY